MVYKIVRIEQLSGPFEQGKLFVTVPEKTLKDELKNIGPETVYFMISILNHLNLDKIRNDILLKVLPLKI